MSLAVLPRWLDAHYEKRCRQGIGEGPSRRRHRGDEHALRRPARARVENVPQPATFVNEMLERRRRRPQGPIAQAKQSQLPRWLARIAQTDRPAARSRLLAQGNDAAV